MKFSAQLSAVAILWSLCAGAYAVHLDSGGRGQVLIYPFYKASEQQQTLLSVTNTLPVAQVAKVRFNEASDGQTTLVFNLWLAPFDTWTATIFAIGADNNPSSGAAIVTTDNSCTSPAFSSSGLSINGRPYLPFTNAAFSGAGSSSLQRSRDGFIEIIAMADVASPLAEIITPSPFGLIPPPPTGCAQVSALSVLDPAMSKPSGGLLGTASIINVGQGTVLTTRAEALDGFTAIPLFTGRDSDQPTLASVNDAGDTLTATASVPVTAGSVQSLAFRDTPEGGQRVDAVSAVLMAAKLYNEFQRSASLSAGSDWLFTFPTRRFYVQTMPDGSVLERAPFLSRVGFPGYLRVSWNVRNRESRPSVFPGCGFICPGSVMYRPWFSMPWKATHSVAFYKPLSPESYFPVLEANVTTGLDVPAEAGWAELGLGDGQERQLPASVEGKILVGLPVVGFWASNIVNNSVSSGVLANYAAAVRHATSVTCLKASDATPCD